MAPSQFQLMQLCKHDRVFRDTAVNPVAAALVRSMIGYNEAKFSSHNCFVKWKGDGYGEFLGLHADQGLSSALVLNANVNWALTDYTVDDGPVSARSQASSSHPVASCALNMPDISLVVLYPASGGSRLPLVEQVILHCNVRAWFDWRGQERCSRCCPNHLSSGQYDCVPWQALAWRVSA